VILAVLGGAVGASLMWPRQDADASTQKPVPRPH
jgi:hypothetical protein